MGSLVGSAGPSLGPMCTGAAEAVMPGLVAPQEIPHAAVHNLQAAITQRKVEALCHFLFSPDCELRNGEGKVPCNSLEC